MLGGLLVYTSNIISVPLLHLSVWGAQDRFSSLTGGLVMCILSIYLCKQYLRGQPFHLTVPTTCDRCWGSAGLAFCGGFVLPLMAAR